MAKCHGNIVKSKNIFTKFQNTCMICVLYMNNTTDSTLFLYHNFEFSIEKVEKGRKRMEKKLKQADIEG